MLRDEAARLEARNDGQPWGASLPDYVTPEFVRDVMGSSAGAGSGEFHVYRALRRREFSRQDFLEKRSEKDIKDDEYHEKLEENKRLAEEKTAKKRAKRERAKQKQKLK